MTTKPKRNQAIRTNESSKRDRCQTPPYALTPLLPYLPKLACIWEPAAGDGLLATVLREHGFMVRESDLLDGQNFFDLRPGDGEIQVTNPPFSTKYEWLKRSYEIGVPFALLMPVDVLGAKKAQRLFDQHGIEVILMDKRVDYKMPNQGWSGKGAQFASAWFTHGLGIGAQLTFAKLHKPSKQRLAEMALGYEQLGLFAGVNA